MRHIRLVVIVLSLGVINLWPAFLEAQEVAKLYSAQGQVEVRLASTTEWKVAAQGTQFNAHDTIRTLQNGRAGVLFGDGILVRLSENSILEFQEKGAAKAPVGLNLGKAFFFTREPKQFPEIKTPVVTASVRGTEFTVEVSKDDTVVSVLDGAVDCNNEFGAVRIARGEQATTHRGSAPVKGILVQPLDAVQWALYYPPVLDISDFGDAGTRATFERSVAAYKKGDYATAYRELGAIKAPRPAGATLFEAGLRLSAGEAGQAETLLSKTLDVINAAPQSTRANLLGAYYSEMAIITLVKNDKEKAFELAKKAVDSGSSSATPAIVMSYIEQSRFNLEEARRWLQEALRRDPENILARARLAEIELGFGNLESAVAEARVASDRAPDQAYPFFILGFAELTRYNTARAKESFTRAIDLDSGAGLPHLGLGLAMIHEGDLSGGREEIEKAVHLEPNVALYRSYLGKAFFEEEREHASGHEYERAIELDPRDPTPYLYRSYYKLSTYRPVEALQDVEQSIELNENRAVYRSKLLLDQDQAVRGAGLSQVFSSLGFDELGRIEAIKSLNRDYSNYSAHLLLADAYNQKDDLLTANISELLIARLLSPVNFNLIQPTSSGIASLNEYNALFDRPLYRTQFDLDGRTKDKLIDAHAVSVGTFGTVGYAIDFDNAYGDGYREDDRTNEQTLYVSAQKEFGSSDTLLIDSNLSLLDDGDNQQSFDPEINDPGVTTKLDDYFVRLGYHHRVGPRQHIIGQVLYNNSDLKVRDRETGRAVIANLLLGDTVLSSQQVGALVDQMIGFKSHGVRFDIQYIADTSLVSFVAGGGMLRSTQEQSDNAPVIQDPGAPPIILSSEAENDENSERSFLYSTWHLAPWVDFNAGLNYTHLQLSGSPLIVPFIDGTRTKTEWNPKAGFTFYPAAGTVLRTAYFETIGSTGLRELELIEPTLVGGFNQVFFDVFPGTKARNFGLGVDQKFSTGTYTGIEATRRHVIRDLPSPFDILNFDALTSQVISQDVQLTLNDAHQDEDLIRGYLYQVLHKTLTGTIDYTYAFTDDEFVDNEIDTHRIRAGLNYFSPQGWFAFGNAIWREQTLDGFDPFFEGVENGTRDFWTADVGIGYQFPKRHGRIVLGIQNIFDQSYRFVPTGLEPMFFPGIGGSLGVSFNF